MSHEKSSQQATLLLDIGNTNLKWSLASADSVGDIVSVPHKGRDVSELAREQWSNIDKPDQVYLANVAGQEMESALEDWISENWGFQPVLVRSTAESCGVINAYSEPERLGVDRWLTLIALRSKTTGPVCVIDCGTAVTIDAMGSDGKHLGGLILPGFGLMQQALKQATAIPIRDEPKLGQLLASDSESAIANGGVNAVAALAEKVCSQLPCPTNATLTTVITGSDARMLELAMSVETRIEHDLVMQGLNALVQQDS